ncbi:TolC family protein [Chryseolinea sp. T2]|uniref:TolC family protein n=1 Tax=Chryseolinea sp. T2 TaxID=3129255 RepID=UPI0030775AEE
MKALSILAISFGLMVITINASAQLSLDQCYRLATENYPLIKQRELILKSRDYNLQNATTGYLPTVSVNAQQTYQSDVTGVPSVPGVEPLIPPVSKNQYKAYGDVMLPLYDGGVVHSQKQAIAANARVEEQSLDVELYKLHERVNQLYFGILLLDGQLEQQVLIREDLQNGLKLAEASIANGTALKSSAELLRAELLRNRQVDIDLISMRTAYLEMLGLLIGQEIAPGALIKPSYLTPGDDVSRPEMQLYEYQRDMLDVENKRLNTIITPRLSTFVQGGYGRPALNMLENNPDTYYIVGFRLNWNLTGFYNRRRDKELINVRRNGVNVQQEVFLFNIGYQGRQQKSEIDRFAQLSASDDEIIVLRVRIKETAYVQLENGVIDSREYLREVQAENLARQSKVLHDIRMLSAQYELQTTRGIDH